MTDIAVAPAAPPNDLAPDELRLRSGPDGSVTVDPERAGWRHLSFRVVVLEEGETTRVGRPGHEAAIVNVAGGDATVAAARAPRALLAGRPSVFDGLPSAFYLPAGRSAQVTGGAGRTTVAIAESPARLEVAASLEPIVIRPDDIRIEVRGAGNATRQINHVIAPDFPADRLEVVEVVTPSGNWSSWPPHKHDVDDMPREAVLEEIYYYRFRRPEAWAIQRLYRGDRSRDALWEVRTGDVVLVTDGYHPFVASHGDDAWYLNALAGDRRTMACSFDPDLRHVMSAWRGMEPDPRVPLVRR